MLDLNRRWLGHHWSFTYPGLSNILLSHLSNGSQVGPQVNLEGTTIPFGQVQVVVEAQRSLIPGPVGFSNGMASASRQRPLFRSTRPEPVTGQYARKLAVASEWPQGTNDIASRVRPALLLRTGVGATAVNISKSKQN